MHYEAITVGNTYSFERLVTEKDVRDFASLTGDRSPLHVDPKFGRHTQYGKNIVHGMLVASFFSTIVGMYCAGKESVYLSQSLQFKLPVFVGDTVTIQGTVVEKYDSVRAMRLKMEAIVDGKVAVLGEARVKVMEV